MVKATDTHIQSRIRINSSTLASIIAIHVRALINTIRATGCIKHLAATRTIIRTLARTWHAATLIVTRAKIMLSPVQGHIQLQCHILIEGLHKSPWLMKVQ